MDRKDKIQMLSDISTGKKSARDLLPFKCYLLHLGILEEFATGKEVTINTFIKRFRPDKDLLLPIVYTAHNLPAEHNFKDPSGEIMKQLINRIPSFDTEENKKFISDCLDLRKTEVWQKIQGDGV